LIDRAHISFTALYLSTFTRFYKSPPASGEIGSFSFLNANRGFKPTFFAKIKKYQGTLRYA
jgi:hypothetical protein